MDEPIEPVQPKSRGKRALELIPFLLDAIDYAYVGLVKDTDKLKVYRDAKALLEEK